MVTCSHVLDSYSQTTNYLLAWSLAPQLHKNPTSRRLHPLSPRGVWKKGVRGVRSPVPAPAELDLMSDLVGGSADFDPIQYLGYSFVRTDTHSIPHKTTVIDVDKETGRNLLEYIHGQTEWVKPNIVQEALLSHAANDDGTNLWTFSTVLDHKTENNQVHVKIQWDNGDVTWEPLNSLRKDDPVTLAKYAHEQGHHK